MQTHDLKRNSKNKKSTQIGRGGKRGKTSGRGGKGQTARAGNKRRPAWRDIIKKLPKKRGYRFNSIRKDEVLDKEKAQGPDGKTETFSKLRKRLGIKGSKIKIK